MDRIAPPFAGFGPRAIPWFDGLAADNSRDYFQRTRAEWQEHVHDPLESLLVEAAERIGGAIKLFRPHRDVRFSNDKRPFKEAASGYVSPPGTMGVFYVQLSREGFMYGTGLWQPERDQLQRLRAAIDDPRRGASLERIIADLEATGMRAGGDALATAPRGYGKDHPRIALLRLKSLTAGATLPPGSDLLGRSALDWALARHSAAEPLTAWLDAHVGPSETPIAERFARG